MAIIENSNVQDINSSSNSSGKNTGSFFHGNVQTQVISIPKPGNSTKVIILPSFDMLKGKSAFAESYVPYREQNSDRLCPITQTPAFTHWAKACRGYTFFGNSSVMFASPLTGKTYRNVKGRLYPPANIDPIVDVGNYIFFHKNELPASVTSLIERNEKGYQRFPRAPRQFVIANALVNNNDSGWYFKVIAFTTAAYEDLIKTLAWRTSKSQNGLTPAFDEFLFGDITDPLTGSVLNVVEKSMSNGPSFAGFNVSKDNMNLTGREPIPQGLITTEILKQRAILNDTDYIDIWSYQKITDLLVRDGMIPVEVIKAAVKPGTAINETSETIHVASKDEESCNDEEDDIPYESMPKPVTHQSQASNIPLKQAPSPVVVEEPVATVHINAEEIEEYKSLAKSISSGSIPDAHAISRFMELQSKYGPVNKY